MTCDECLRVNIQRKEIILFNIKILINIANMDLRLRAKEKGHISNNDVHIVMQTLESAIDVLFNGTDVKDYQETKRYLNNILKGDETKDEAEV